MMRMAWTMAWRITGSPTRLTSRDRTVRGCLISSGPGRITRPVSISAQVEALTKMPSPCPRWASQSAPPILSAISRSAVSASGIRSSASARHISATPKLWRVSRTCPTRAAARAFPRFCASPDSTASGIRASTVSVSSAR